MSQVIEKSKRVSISHGNSKMGLIPSVSLPPIVTCPRGCPCAKKCYAAKLCRLYPSVRAAYQRNYDILMSDRKSYFEQIKNAAEIERFFRWHVSGDIVCADYFDNMVKIAEELPNTRFLAFTKQYAIVNSYLDKHNGVLPENLVVIFSAWGDGWDIPNPYNLPVAQVVFNGCDPLPDWFVCGGNCTTCACRGVGCWQIKRGQTICFKEH